MPYLTALLLALQDAPTGTGDGAPPSSGGSGMDFLLPMILVVVIFWVVMIGPERKNRKKREAMLASLKKGDPVLTTGGLYGTVAQVKDQVVTLQVADGVRLRYALGSIQSRLEEPSAEPETAQAETAKKA